jgi:uncharacterized membrane protein
MKRLNMFSRYTIGILFILAGINHFLNPNLYLQIMPPYLPWRNFFVYLSGVLEILFGALLFVPSWATVAAWGVIFVLITVFPANLHMALNAQDFSPLPSVLLWLRLPFQVVLIAWAYWHTR